MSAGVSDALDYEDIIQVGRKVYVCRPSAGPTKFGLLWKRPSEVMEYKGNNTYKVKDTDCGFAGRAFAPRRRSVVVIG